MSVGIVADPKFVPFDSIRRYPELLEWLGRHEPQLAERLPKSEDELLDFRKIKNYAYGTRRGLSPQRWALTGEAGLFLDPLYATGLDFIAVSNTLATRLVCESLAGEEWPEFRRRLKAYNSIYLGQFMGWEPAFAGQYEVFRDPVVTSAKVLWDNVAYFMYPVLLFNQDYMTDRHLVAQARDLFRPHFRMNVYMQECFRMLSREDCDVRDAGFAVGTDHLIAQLFEIAAGELTKDEVLELVGVNIRRIHQMSVEMCDRLWGACGKEPPPRPDYGVDQGTGEDLIHWSAYAQKTAPPAETEPQPEGSWMIR
jgi:hypothetical protein